MYLVSRHAILRCLCAILCLSVGGAARADFAQWQQTARAQALQSGISPETIDRVLPTLEYIQAAITLDRKQPEKKLTFFEYYANMVTPDRIREARTYLSRHNTMLRRVEEAYGVPAQYITALWGIESHFGQNMGSYDLPSVLATLAYEGRRAELFMKEFIASLQMLERGIPRTRLTGSWAGAMGQTQFLPSSYLRYAVDFDRDGTPNIWSSHPDVFASIANYLASEGWDRNGACVRRVHVPAGFTAPKPWSSVEKPVEEWLRLGIKPTDERPLDLKTVVRLLVHDHSGDVGYLAYPNFSVIMKWNRSTFFATTVCRLAEQIKPMEMGSNP